MNKKEFTVQFEVEGSSHLKVLDQFKKICNQMVNADIEILLIRNSIPLWQLLFPPKNLKFRKWNLGIYSYSWQHEAELVLRHLELLPVWHGNRFHLMFCSAGYLDKHLTDLSEISLSEFRDFSYLGKLSSGGCIYGIAQPVDDIFMMHFLSDLEETYRDRLKQ